MMRDSASISIVCFGDSLTAGYQSPTHDVSIIRETPFGSFLQARLGPQATVMTSGVCGEVTSDMLLRFRQDVLAHRPDYVVILGGTNDLGWHVAPAEIVSHLLCMYEQAFGVGIQPVAVTVPSIRMEVDPAAEQWLNELVTQRQHLNRSIIEYCANKGIACVDLFTATAEAKTLLLAGPYSNDGLHLTTEGYRKMADLLYEQVFQSRVPGHD
ncbi:MAG: hypothetical protein H0W13_09025 [Nitrospirales bacterium]|nr:hypothetical protein [Nitrospirales bacterium]